MTSEAQPEKLTLWAAIKDLGWLPLLLIGFGGFSTLAILEQGVFRQPLELVQIFQWPLDGYHRVMRLLGGVADPLIQPTVDWVNTQLDWSITLDPIWRPLFALAMVMVIAPVRAVLAYGRVYDGFVHAVGFTLGALTGAVVAGLFSSEADWSTQGLVAAAPVSCMLLGRACGEVLHGLWSEVWGSILVAFGGGFILFSGGAALSFVPGFAMSGGLLALGGAIALCGVFSVTNGLREADHLGVRIGLTVLGGFVAAALIMGADFALKAMG